jgi:hypothetical protein
MRYKLLGNTGLRVSELCLGTMTFGEEWGFGAPKEESRRIFEAFAEAGGNFVDTANLYTGGTSERFVGEFVKGRRDRFVLATKYTMTMSPDDPNAGGNHRKNLVQSLEASLSRLGTDYVDLLWVHAHDVLTPVEETMRALDDAVRAGKLLYVGSRTPPHGSSPRRTRSRRSKGGRRSPPSRSSTACRSGPPSANCCRWPARSGSPSPPGGSWAEACSPGNTGRRKIGPRGPGSPVTTNGPG